MTFFLLVVVFLTAGILVLHRGLQFIGCRVTYAALIAAVLLSGFVTFLGLRFIPFLTDAFYWCVALMVLTAAFLTAGLDAYLLRGETPEEASAPAQAGDGRAVGEPTPLLRDAVEAPVQALPAAPALSAPSAEPEDRIPADDSAPVPAEETTAAQIYAPQAQAPPDIIEEPEDASAAPAAIAADAEDTPAVQPEIDEIPGEAYAAASDVVTDAEWASITLTNAVEDGEDIPVDVPADDSAQAASTSSGTAMSATPVDAPTDDAVQAERSDVPTGAAASEERVGTVPSDTGAEDAQPALPEDLARELASLETLDNYLDFAFQEERGGRMRNAVLVYRRAMELYAGDDYAPFIAIELSNVCKEIGDFPAAAEALERGLHFPAVQANLAMVQEFRKNIRFLQTLHHMLERESLSGIPLRQVPKSWQDIAEEMAKETRGA